MPGRSPRPSSEASPPPGRWPASRPGAFRPLLRWVLAAGQDQGSLVESLQSLAPMYRKRGAFQAEKLQIFLPTVLMLFIGGSATLLYGLTLFVPLSSMLAGLATP